MGMKEKIKSCVGCGFCCKKAPCSLALRIFGNVTECPMLIWDENAHRYWCDACRKGGEVGARNRVELYIGEGCCCGLNSDRNNIRPPEKATSNILSREAQILLAAIGREWISGDEIYFILERCKEKLGEEWVKAAAHLIQEQKSSSISNFVG